MKPEVRVKTFWKTAVLSGAALVLMTSGTYAAQPEDLLGISLDNEKQEITIEVVGSGCTQKKHFLFEMKENTLTIVRTERDACKAMPDKTSLTFSLREAGIEPNKSFRIGNKFIANKYIANMQKKP